MRVYLLDTKSLLFRVSSLVLMLLAALAFWEYEMTRITGVTEIQKIAPVQSIILISITTFGTWTAKIFAEKTIVIKRWSILNIFLLSLILIAVYFIFAFLFLGFIIDHKHFLDKGIWRYYIKLDTWDTILFQFWYFLAAIYLSICYFIAYKNTRIAYIRRWKFGLFITYTIMPLVMVYSFVFVPIDESPAHYFLSPFIAIMGLMLTSVYTNFKLFEINPASAIDEIMDSMSNLVLLLDPDFKITYLNKAGYKIFEIGDWANSIIGTNFSTFLERWDISNGEEFLNQLALLKKGEQIEQEIMNEDQFLLVLVSGIYKQQHIKTGYLVMGLDLSPIKRKELELQNYATRLEQSNKELERFAYIASHDLKSPLRNIVSFVNLLERKLQYSTDQDAKDYMHFISSNASYMYQLIQDILEYSKLRDYPSGNWKQVSLNSIVDQISLGYQNRDWVLNCSRLPEVRSSPILMKQLFQNLIDNSIKYNDHSHPEITIHSTKVEEGYQFCIRDNGIGIEKGYQKVIFEMFKRLHNQSKYEGTGIGLAICKKIVEMHQGEIWLESEPGKGTIFFFTLK